MLLEQAGCKLEELTLEIRIPCLVSDCASYYSSHNPDALDHVAEDDIPLRAQQCPVMMGLYDYGVYGETFSFLEIMLTLRRVQLRILHHEELVCHVDLGPGGGGRVGGLRRDSDDRTGPCVRHVVGKALDTADEDVLALVPLFVEVGEAAYEL